ncbi:uracil-DNA glycosylase family protein [uncultured Arcobacter sp.]|uniref:uracil-DNA glycosylase family protein n=1 Tax=uncultured Arcobacter sp. TaxID=165434 RepID=UPI0026071C6F|nr:uracil-DNA glycosylase family protein [uncultured Arcobacter sp.]
MFFHFHPYKPFLNDKTKKILVGTLPPPRFCNKQFKESDVDFCYGSKDNLLWQVLNKIHNLNLPFDKSIESTNLRKEFLIKNQIGVCDIVQSCKREKIDASDIGMSEVVLRDILGFIKKYKNIQTIIFTGGLCKNSPEYFFRQVLKKENIALKLICENIPKKHKFTYDNREIQTISLTSPSNAANRSIGANEYYKKMKKENPNYTTFDFRVEQYEKVFK